MLSGLHKLTKEEAEGQEIAETRNTTPKHQQLTLTGFEYPDDSEAEVPETITYSEDEIIGYIVIVDSPYTENGTQIETGTWMQEHDKKTD